MTAFFTADELAMHLQIDNIDEDMANMLADLASDTIRDDLRQLINPVTADQITIYGDGGELIVLPERPVTAVTAVLLAGQPIPAFDWRPNGALRRVIYPGSQFAGEQTMNWPFGVPVQVTYSHGYATVPNTIKAMALQLAVGSFVNPRLLAMITVDDITEKYEKTSGTGGLPAMLLSDEQRRQMDRYRMLDI